SGDLRALHSFPTRRSSDLAGVFGAMFMAIFKSHWKNGFWNSKRGLEFPLSLLAGGVTIGLTGPGSYSLDALFGITLPSPLLFLRSEEHTSELQSPYDLVCR